MNWKKLSTHKAFSLIEVLVALLMLSTAVLLSYTVLVRALAINTEALQLTIANRIIANQAEYLHIQENENLAKYPDSLEKYLPGASVTFIKKSPRNSVIQISWRAKNNLHPINNCDAKKEQYCLQQLFGF